MRRFAAGLESAPEGFDLDPADTARELGVGARGGRNSPFQRAVGRCVTFELARQPADAVLAVRRRFPPLPRRLLLRLPDSLQELHIRWSEPQEATPGYENMKRRSRRLALDLLEVTEEREAVEVQLLRWRLHPALAHEATEWAWTLRVRAARAAAAAHVGPSCDQGS